jgi:hypothetical protein
MRIACWIPAATDALFGYAILTDFPLQQWLHGSASILRYTYIVSGVCIKLNHLL